MLKWYHVCLGKHKAIDVFTPYMWQKAMINDANVFDMEGRYVVMRDAVGHRRGVQIELGRLGDVVAVHMTDPNMSNVMMDNKSGKTTMRVDSYFLKVDKKGKLTTTRFRKLASTCEFKRVPMIECCKEEGDCVLGTLCWFM